MENSQTWQKFRRPLTYLAALAVYAIIAIPLSYRHREHLHADLVAYIRRAIYFCQGDFYHFITGYWSPFISISIAPFLGIFKMDGLYAAHAMIAVWGGLLVIAFGLFLDSFFDFHWIWKLAAMIVVAAHTATVGQRQITPDPILSACLLAYFAALYHPRLHRPRGYVLAGLLGGMAYLGKGYGFPFVAIHLPMTFILRALTPRRAPVTSRAAVAPLRGLAFAIIGFLLAAGPWVAAISCRYHHLTFSTAGPIAHAIVGPSPSARIFPPFTPPQAPYIIDWENPESITHVLWSPFSSRQNFYWQLQIIGGNAKRMYNDFCAFDLLHLCAISVVLGALAAVGVLPLKTQRMKVTWLLLTILLYCAGFLPMFYTDRYMSWLILPLTLVLFLIIILDVRLPRRPVFKGRSAFEYAPNILAVILLISLALAAGRLIEMDFQTRPSGIYRGIAHDIIAAGLRGPIASNDRIKTYYVALHTGQRFVGFPPDLDPQVADRKLHEAGVRMLILWPDDYSSRFNQEAAECAAAVAKLPTWQKVPRRKQSIEIFVPAEAAR